MDVWHVVLEEGFQSDDVVVRAGGDALYEGEGISTNPHLGYAVSFEVAISAGSQIVVEVPTRTVTCDFVLPDSPGRQVVVSIVDDGLQFLTPQQARGYA